MTSKYDAWLTAAPDNTDEEEYIDERVHELLKTEYDPANISHMSEAISEAGEENQQIIRDYIEQGNWQELGRKLFFISYEYMEGYATRRAEGEIADGYHL